jgi:transmembrane sensor
MFKRRNKQTYEEASEWLVELRSGDMDAAARERLDAWFRESPQHIRAFLEVSSLWEEGGDPDLDRDNSTSDLIARARATPSTGENVIALNGEGLTALEHPRGSTDLGRRAAKRGFLGALAPARFFTWPAVALASGVLACLAWGFVALHAHYNPSYATDVGQQRTVQLSDGSSIEINSKSQVRVLFSKNERNVELIRGQALFRVAKDPARPFVVRSDGTRVRAVGTQFDVYKKASGTTVTVVEGRVAVLAPPPAQASRTSPAQPSLLSVGEGARGASEVFVSTGEQVTVSDQVVSDPRPADTSVATAWTKRELVFDMTPLSEVVREFNRYNTQKLVVSDPALTDFHVTGIFASTDPAPLLRFLRAQRGIEVVEAGKELRISKK